MKKFSHWLILCVLLMLSGTAIMAYKVSVLGYPIKPGQQEDSWTVQARVELKPGEGPVKVALKLPAQSPGFARLQEDYISRGFGLSITDEQWSREANWAIRRVKGRQVLYYRGIFYRDSGLQELAPKPDYPPVPQLEEPFQTAMLAVVDDVRRHSADIASFTRKLLTRLNEPVPSEEMRLFLNAPDYRDNKVRIARTLLAGARIPTHQINGILLSDLEQRATPVQWLAVHNEQRWIYFDPATGQQGQPSHLLMWWLGEESAAHVEGGTLKDLQWSVRRNDIGALELAQQRARDHQSALAEVSLLNLPLQTQLVYSVLLLVPVGGLVIVFMRNVIGVRSFGTFMPVLIALAFRETGLLAGIILFAVVVALGLSFRFYLERLRLLLVPRLTAVLTIVVILMVAVSIVSDRLGIEVGLSVGLFPMVILTMVIERMSIVWEERSPYDAFLEGTGSMLIAALTYLVMGLEIIQYQAFVFPELLLVVLAVTILMGRYTGYRLTELLRFRSLSA